ncbi:4-(cytidine 5'-diphospho)-2-C-methyl-D-erythritol kinase [Microvirga sp. W0021]|uniref:4-diphosphocytidyl-2-C-methyl-D-erythritol kinase n=1 Tax=Hohaiivirga grylli TaxID=3133970 RepID=A0ABV0BJE3_9HYPH
MPAFAQSLPLYSFAPAKINLSLHVCGRRSDGYHDIESLVAFASEGDGLTLVQGEALALEITGPFAFDLQATDDNLIFKAVKALQKYKSNLRLGTFHLEKRLPVSSGIGGGSTDAAAALRLIAQINNIPFSDPDLIRAASETGADVPVCLETQARIMRGIGDHLEAPVQLPRISVLLINPGISVSTPAVFSALGLEKGQQYRSADAMQLPVVIKTQEQLISLLMQTENDLQAPAISQCPKIAKVLNALEALSGCEFARMSGSGATVFGIFDNFDHAESAAASVSAQHPHWWAKPAWLK